MPDQLDIYYADFLAMAAGRVRENPALIFTMRPDSRSFAAYNFSFTPAQARRIHDDLERLLNDPDSWLYVAEEHSQMMEES